MKNSISPLEELRQEKVIVKRECEEIENRLAGQWAYLSDNAVPLVLDSIVSGIMQKLGFGGHHRVESQKKDNSSSVGFANGILGNLSAYTPLLWDLIQPMLWKFAVNKIKSIFTGKKKKKKDDDD